MMMQQSDTADQLTMFGPVLVDHDEDSIAARFVAFHRDNPQVYDALVRLARRGVRAGRTRLGMKQLFEVLRWERALRTSGDEFKLNNSFTSHYARLIMETEPDLVDVFETRRADSVEAVER